MTSRRRALTLLFLNSPPARSLVLYGYFYLHPSLQGVSNCFRKDEDGKLTEVQVIEPINATTLETMNIGAATSFRYVTGVTLGDVVGMDKAALDLPEDYLEAEFCEDFKTR